MTRFPSWETAYPCEPNPIFQPCMPPRFSMDNLFSTAAGRVRNLVQASFGAEVFGTLLESYRKSKDRLPARSSPKPVGEKADLIVMAKRKPKTINASLRPQYFGSGQRTGSVSGSFPVSTPSPAPVLCPSRAQVSGPCCEDPKSERD